MTARLPVGVVGVGALGRHHARHLASMDGVELVGLYDHNPETLARVAAEVGVPAFSELDSLLGRVKGISIAVPTSVHGELGLQALERGVAVMMEKPLAATLAEADALVAAARQAGVVLHVGQIERYNRAVRAALPAVENPRYIEAERIAPFSPRGTDVSVVLDLMIHDLDLLLALTGSPAVTDVRAVGAAVLSSHLDMVNARLELPGGTVASVTASRIGRQRVRRLRIYQDTGYLVLDLTAGQATFLRIRPDWRPGTGGSLEEVVEEVVLEAPEGDALRLELTEFARAVRGEPNRGVTGVEGRAALDLALRVGAVVRPT
ncbi:MAG TPA: Gfo/Idh/MocA family oxidoreductase [Gemmatimonadales bacterium]|nr:Gfo/Idh/MocA family oxidoreductase [Gemmatimonadales bacterium]